MAVVAALASGDSARLGVRAHEPTIDFAGVKVRTLTSMVAPYRTRGEVNKRLASLPFAPQLLAPRTRPVV